MAKTGRILTLIVALAAVLWVVLFLIGAMSFGPWLRIFILIVVGGGVAILVQMIRDRMNDPEDRHYSDTVDK